MVAFYLPDKGLDLMDGDLMRSMNLGDCTISNGHLQVDYRGLNPKFTEQELTKIEEAGLIRADTNWYIITPEPNESQREKLSNVFNHMPSTTILPTKECPELKVSFVEALSDKQIAKMADMKLTVKKTEPQLIPIR